MANNNPVWKPVVGYEGLYEVSDSGVVRGVERVDVRGQKRKAKVLKTSVNRGGYETVCLSKDRMQTTYTIHRIVLEAFVGPRPEGQQGCHGKGGKRDNSLSNLRWDTVEANGRDKVLFGEAVRGERQHLARLSEGDIRRIRALPELSLSRLAEMFNVGKSTIGHVRRGNTWKHVNA